MSVSELDGDVSCMAAVICAFRRAECVEQGSEASRNEQEQEQEQKAIRLIVFPTNDFKPGEDQLDPLAGRRLHAIAVRRVRSGL